MEIKLPTGGMNSMLGAALAGLSMATPSAHAAVFTEGTDFSNLQSTTTDLTSQFPDFLTGNTIIGTLVTGFGIGVDNSDYAKVAVMPSTLTSLVFTISPTMSTSLFFQVSVSTEDGTNLGSATGFDATPLTLTFTTPVAPSLGGPSNIVLNVRDGESTGGNTLNYTISSVPETSSAVLGLAGMAAAALRRRRKVI